MDNNYALDDPVFEEAEQSLVPFTWSSDVPKKSWSAKSLDILDEAKSADIAHGVSIPFQVFNGRTGAMTFASALPHSEFLEVYENSKNDLSLAAMYFHAYVQALVFRKEDKKIYLTDREYEVLFRCVSGREIEQIATDLKISTATVRAHIRNINVKYGTKSIRNACIAAVANLDVDLPTQELIGLYPKN